MALWRKAGGTPTLLPFQDIDADGSIWTDLANSADGRDACDWAEAPEQPDYDAATQLVEWTNGAWAVRTLPSRKLSALAFKQRLTGQERMAIRAAAATDPIITDFLDLLDTPGAGLIELDHADTVAGVEYLVAHDLLTADRAVELRA